MIKLVLSVCLFVAISAEDADPDWRVIGSLRVYPHILHKCYATYIYPGYFVTVASCVDGIDVNSTYIQVNTESILDKNATIVKVMDVYIHPNYKTNNADNIALLRTNYIMSNINDALVGYNMSSIIQGYVRLFKLHENLKDFALTTTSVESVLDSNCDIRSSKAGSDATNTLCVLLLPNVTLGYYDQGTPFLKSTLVNGTQKTKVYGIRVSNGLSSRSDYFLYLSNYIPWMTNVIRNNRVDCPTVKVSSVNSLLYSTYNSTSQ